MSLPRMLEFSFNGFTAAFDITVPAIEIVEEADGTKREGVLFGVEHIRATMTLQELKVRNAKLHDSICEIFREFDAEVRKKSDEAIADPAALRAQAVQNDLDRREIERKQAEAQQEAELLASQNAENKRAAEEQEALRVAAARAADEQEARLRAAEEEHNRIVAEAARVAAETAAAEQAQLARLQQLEADIAAKHAELTAKTAQIAEVEARPAEAPATVPMQPESVEVAAVDASAR